MKSHILRKRVCALAAMAAVGAMGTAAHAQFSDNFNSEANGTSPPAMWTQVLGSDLTTPATGASIDWTVGTVAYQNAAADFFTMPANLDNSPMAYFDDDLGGSGFVHDLALISPAFDTSSSDTVLFSYDRYFRLGPGSFTVYVYDGTVWQVVEALATTSAWANMSFDVTAYKNASMRVAFRYNDAGGWGYGAGIDNVQVIGLAGANINIFDASVAEGDSGTTALNFPVTAVPAPPGNILMDYDITFTGAADAADISSALSGTYTFVGDGSTTMGSLTIDIVGDEFPEQDETFTITISNPDSGGIVDGVAIGTILDDDFICNSEDFSGASDPTPPAGWTAQSLAGTGSDTWRFSGAQPVLPPIVAPFAIMDSDTYGNSAAPDEVDELVSPSFDLSTGDLASLSFDQIYRHLAGSSSVVEVSTDGGTVWTPLLTQNTASVGNPTTGAPASTTINISSYLGQSDVRFRWVMTHSYDWWWIIDNVSVCTGSLPAGVSTVTAGVASANEDGTRGGGGLQIPVNASPAATGDITVNWSITGGTAASGTNYGGPMSGAATILNGATSGTIDIPVMDDSVRSGPLTVEVTIDSVSANGFLASTQVGTGSILNTQAMATAYLFGFDYFVNGGADPASMFEGGLASFGATFSILGDAADPNLGLGGDFVNNDFTTFYYVAGTGATGELVAVDTTSMLPTVVGALTGFDTGDTPNGFCWDIETGNAYVSGNDGAGGYALYTINLGTAAVTKVADITGATSMSELAIDGITGQMYAADNANDQLLAINKATGAASVVGAFGFDANYFPGMEFDDSTGTGYIAVTDDGPILQSLYTINTSTGALTLAEAIETNQGIGQSSAIAFSIATPPFSSVSDWMAFE